MVERRLEEERMAMRSHISEIDEQRRKEMEAYQTMVDDQRRMEMQAYQMMMDDQRRAMQLQMEEFKRMMSSRSPDSPPAPL